MDQAVLKTQQWLNQNYSGKIGYTAVLEDGATGWGTMKGLITALQIELGIASPNGNFGPATRQAFKNLSAGSTQTNQIYILQGALFCKGYNPGGFTGTFGDNTKKAVIQLQSDAGLSNPNGIVNSLLMKSLLSMDAFVLLNYGGYHGDSNIRKIQQNLNRDYSSNEYFAIDIGLVPCDGIYGRSTNKALLYALQIEEGITQPNGVFGPTTKAKCPTISTGTTNSKYVYLLQYALYCNGFKPNEFNGQYDNGAKIAVTNFQKFACLDADGIAGMKTWASLLVSTGDPSRKGTMCDCSTTITPDKAQTLVANGYKSVGRYLTGKFKMTSSELNTIFAAGLKVFPIFETGGYQLSYFNALQGNKDAKAAIAEASRFGFDSGTIIYFTVDFDALDGNVTSSILPYFREIYGVFKRTNTTYKIGIYAPRNVCSRVSEAGYSSSSFVCDMSSGFSGNLGYPLPKDWAIDQISTITIGSGSGQIEIDNNISSGRDMGVSKINPGNNAAGIVDPHSQISERIVISGSEYDAAIDFGPIKLKRRYKYNFIEPAINELKELKRQYPSDIVTWLISSTDYDYKDIENFKDTARKLEVNIRFFDTDNEVIKYLNTNRTECKIGNLTIFAHGIPGCVEFGYKQKNQTELSFNIYDFKYIESSSFRKDAYTKLYSCNGATKVDENCEDFGLLKDLYGKSFAEEWYKSGFGKIRAANGKTDYSLIFGDPNNEDDINKHLAEGKEKGYCENGAVNYPAPTAKGVICIEFPEH